MPFGLHVPELIIVLVIALLVFGPKKLPEMGSAIGKSIKEFQKGMKEVTHPKDDEQPAPKEAIEAPAMPISNLDMSKLENRSYASEEVTAQHPND
jgi:sec-independent protein translocase protein TatA